MFISRTHFSEVSKAKVTPGGPFPYSISEIFLLRCEIWAPFSPFIAITNVLVVIRLSYLLLHLFMYYFPCSVETKTYRDISLQKYLPPFCTKWEFSDLQFWAILKAVTYHYHPMKLSLFSNILI